MGVCVCACADDMCVSVWCVCVWAHFRALARLCEIAANICRAHVWASARQYICRVCGEGGEVISGVHRE